MIKNKGVADVCSPMRRECLVIPHKKDYHINRLILKMYEAREDSFLLLKHIKDYAKGKKVLDVGTGSGILALEASKYAENVLACDIEDKIIDKLKKEKNNSKVTYFKSDLFSNISEKFDLILFNPPYLPSEKIKHVDLDGGKNGTEIIEEFLKQAGKYLNKDGKILLLCSSLNKGIEQIFKKCKYRYKKIDEQKFFFEKLFVYELA